MGKRHKAQPELTLTDVPGGVLVELYELMQSIEPVLNRLLTPGIQGKARFQGVKGNRLLDAVSIGEANSSIEVRIDLQKYSPLIRADRQYLLLAFSSGLAGLRAELESRTHTTTKGSKESTQTINQ